MRTLDRKGTGCVKWDAAEDSQMLPLWVADMDFETAPAIIEAIQRRAAHGIYGYTLVQPSYYDAVVRWFDRRHGWKMHADHLIYTTGVVPAVSAIIDAMARPGDDVVTFAPAYNCFFSSIRNKGCRLSASALTYDPATRHYEIDFADLEARLSEPKATVMLLCNPHNPTGRVWTADELRRIGDLCLKYGVFVISDEIHCEFVRPGYKYIPYASLGETYAQHCAVCTSPSKAFNIAGLQAANITVPSDEARRRIDRAINDAEVCDLGVFGPVAVEAAYNYGEAWLDELNAAIVANSDALEAYLAAHHPDLLVTRAEGTYLPWVNCAPIVGEGKRFATSTALCEHLKAHHLWLNPGDMYDDRPSAFVRFNVACSAETLDEALRRFTVALSA